RVGCCGGLARIISHKTRLVPGPGNVLKLVKHISSVVEANTADGGRDPAERKLLRPQGVVEEPLLHELVQELALLDPHTGTLGVVRLVRSIRCGHGGLTSLPLRRGPPSSGSALAVALVAARRLLRRVSRHHPVGRVNAQPLQSEPKLHTCGTVPRRKSVRPLRTRAHPASQGRLPDRRRTRCFRASTAAPMLV